MTIQLIDQPGFREVLRRAWGRVEVVHIQSVSDAERERRHREIITEIA